VFFRRRRAYGSKKLRLASDSTASDLIEAKSEGGFQIVKKVEFLGNFYISTQIRVS
jgi:hypothetical protein